MKRAFGYTLLLLWAAAMSALQLVGLACAPWLEKGSALVARAAVPDLATVLLVAAVGRLSRLDAVRVAVAVAIGRVGFTESPPFAVLAGCIAVALSADSMRRFAELGRPSLRLASAGIGALLYSSWLILVDLVRASEARAAEGFGFGAIDGADLLLPLVTATTSAVAALIAWPLFSSLPGLAQLDRRAF